VIAQALNAAVMAPEQAFAVALQRVTAAVSVLQQQLDSTDDTTTASNSSSSSASTLRLDAALQALTALTDAAAAVASSSGDAPQRRSVVPELRQAYAELTSEATSAAGASPYLTVVTVTPAPTAVGTAASTAAGSTTAAVADATVVEAEWSSDAVYSSSSSDAYTTATTTTSSTAVAGSSYSDSDSTEVLVGELVAAGSSDGVVDLEADDVQEVEDETVGVSCNRQYFSTPLKAVYAMFSCCLCSQQYV
jgi:hypothetical protein